MNAFCCKSIGPGSGARSSALAGRRWSPVAHGYRSGGVFVLSLLVVLGWATVLKAQEVGSGSASELPPSVRFKAARAALSAGDRDSFLEHAESLEGHSLQLELWRADLQSRLDQASADEVLAFIERHRGTAPAERIRRGWLERLARERRWSEYVESYVDDGSDARACWYRRALLNIGREQEAFGDLSSLYLTARSLPPACDPLFAAWSRQGGLTPALAWTRIEQALMNGNTGVAAYQSRYLPPDQQPWVELLVAVHRRPAMLLEEPVTADRVSDPMRRQRLLVHGVERLAPGSPAQARLLHASILAAEQLPTGLAERLDIALGEAFARAGEPEALGYLERIEPRPDNADLQQRRLRAALRLRAWPELARWAGVLTSGADPLGKWRYWRGQALLRSAVGSAARAAAAHSFASAATERSLWGFASAELVGRPLALEHRPVPIAREDVDALLASETAARVRALADLGRQTDVSREWRDLTQAMGRAEKLVAAVGAAELGLANESILTLARAAYWDDLELRFPLAYRRLVDEASSAHDLAPDWLYAVIRQESAFDPDIASHAGAVGLMQLMPATAREVAVKTGREPPERLALIDPALNIALGSAYLAEMQSRFDGHALVASAAYNAGPNAVRRWIPKQPVDGDLWLTEIPYGETRTYVRRVLTYRIIYRHRLGLPPLRVGALLRPVGE